jgi:glyoxylase-like metal-dependent hydrolase (beta-lactamase superfamily II)
VKPVASPWFEVVGMREGLTLIREPHVDAMIRSNTWLLRGSRADLLIDAGLGLAPLPLPRDDRPLIALATHAHYDHVGGMSAFDEVLAHPAEAEELRTAADAGALVADQIPAEERVSLSRAGYPLEGELLSAYPYAGFDPRSYVLRPTEPTRLVDDGDAIDLGDPVLEILHLPGHTPGSIGLFDRASGELFTGDAVYDGPLLDELPGSDITSYLETMERLCSIPARVVHAGHDESFGRERLVELCRGYLRRRGG